MQEIRKRRVSGIGLRIAAPKLARVLALLLLAGGVAAVVISYWRLKDNEEFRLKPGKAQLSTEVVGIIDGLEHREMKNGRLWVVLKADRDLKFSDGHHKLENVNLEVYPEQGDKPDKISSRETLTNEDNTQFLFTGAVNIETRDGMVVKTEQVEYDVKKEFANVTAPVEFVRENIHGRADTGSLEAKVKKLALKGGVEITVEPAGGGQQQEGGSVPKMNLRGKPVTVKSAQADFDQIAMRIEFTGGAVAEQGSDVMSGDSLGGLLNEQKHVKHILARGNSYLRSMSPGHSAEVFAAEFDFYFDDNQKLQTAQARQNVRGRTLDADSDAELVSAATADIDFGVQEDRSIIKELRAGGRPVVTLGAPKSKAGDPKAANKRVTADDVRLFWRQTGKDLERAEANGNAELLVEPVQPVPTADRKKLFASVLRCNFYEAGNLARDFNASGDARAVVEPLQETPRRGTRTLTAPEMAATFVRETQDVESFVAAGGAKFVERERVLTSQRMNAFFSRETSALDRVEALGDAKFVEQDRNGQSATMTYTAGDGVVHMRGGEPVAWDSRARLKAVEIDSNTVTKVSYARGKVLTTYYSQEQTGGAAPFKNVKSPVYVASANAEFQHESGTGVYTGNARAWQDDNFVKGDRIVLHRDQKRMDAEGNVQSALYQARRREASGERVVVPVFATSRSMTYTDGNRLIHYEDDVDIKQGTERITGGVADVYLMKETYEVERTVAQRDVVVTQPGRKGTGDWAQYTAADETVVLTGNPAHVEDAEKGTSESRRMTVYLREDRVVSDGGGEPGQPTGRVRTTHKIKKQ
ncbi:MAG TPA: LPS export ABC transporter periplasmic protein LptC [Pyrinomonadaceae bacterium]|nr:LPS export ABC transporter periplasmic protein LptC [Pyrinomonadaceae bacterium]